MNNINTTIPRGILEIARPNLETLAKEFDAGRGLRVAAVADVLVEDLGFDDAYEVRAHVAALFGHDVAGADDEEGMHGIPAIEAFMELRGAYGSDWARLAYEDYLTHYSATPCREPAAVAAAVFNRSMQEYCTRTATPKDLRRVA